MAYSPNNAPKIATPFEAVDIPQNEMGKIMDQLVDSINQSLNDGRQDFKDHNYKNLQTKHTLGIQTAFAEFNQSGDQDALRQAITRIINSKNYIQENGLTGKALIFIDRLQFNQYHSSKKDRIEEIINLICTNLTEVNEQYQTQAIASPVTPIVGIRPVSPNPTPQTVSPIATPSSPALPQNSSTPTFTLEDPDLDPSIPEEIIRLTETDMIKKEVQEAFKGIFGANSSFLNLQEANQTTCDTLLDAINVYRANITNGTPQEDAINQLRSAVATAVENQNLTPANSLFLQIYQQLKNSTKQRSLESIQAEITDLQNQITTPKILTKIQTLEHAKLKAQPQQIETIEPKKLLAIEELTKNLEQIANLTQPEINAILQEGSISTEPIRKKNKRQTAFKMLSQVAIIAINTPALRLGLSNIPYITSIISGAVSLGNIAEYAAQSNQRQRDMRQSITPVMEAVESIREEEPQVSNLALNSVKRFVTKEQRLIQHSSASSRIRESQLESAVDREIQQSQEDILPNITKLLEPCKVKYLSRLSNATDEERKESERAERIINKNIKNFTDTYRDKTISYPELTSLLELTKNRINGESNSAILEALNIVKEFQELVLAQHITETKKNQDTLVQSVAEASTQKNELKQNFVSKAKVMLSTEMGKEIGQLVASADEPKRKSKTDRLAEAIRSVESIQKKAQKTSNGNPVLYMEEFGAIVEEKKDELNKEIKNTNKNLAKARTSIVFRDKRVSNFEEKLEVLDFELRCYDKLLAHQKKEYGNITKILDQNPSIVELLAQVETKQKDNIESQKLTMGDIGVEMSMAAVEAASLEAIAFVTRGWAQNNTTQTNIDSGIKIKVIQ